MSAGGGGGRPCDSPAASFYTRSDSASLYCADHDAHALTRRHSCAVAPLCDVCERTPAHVTCKADDAALCAVCDRVIHSANPLARRHERVPITRALESPPAAAAGLFSAAEDEAEAEAATWILPDLKPADSPDMDSTRYSFETTDPYLDLDYAPAKTKFDLSAAAADGVVPVQSKNSAAALTSSATILDSRMEFDFGGSKYNSYTVPCSSSVEAGVVPDDDSGNGGNQQQQQQQRCVGEAANRTAVQQITGADREARVLRYREKRKARRFEKTIRYASRKAYAETRPRIKGRFAKRVDLGADVDRMYGPPDVLTGYGVVPSF